MSNPFEKDDETYLVLVNEEGQHSLWPSFVAVPRGWSIALPATSRRECLDYVNQHWTDMRPRSLILEMEGDGRAPTQGGTTAARESQDARAVASN